jgi:HlyD family secretion protein
MKKRLKIILPVLIVAIGITLWYKLPRSTVGTNPLRVSGNIEVTQVNASFKIPGRLLIRLVDEGQRVQAGQLIARLDPTDQTLRVNQAAAQLAYAKARLEELEAGSRIEEIQKAEAGVEQAQFALRELETGSRRQEIVESEASLQQAIAAQKGAESQYRLAQADFKRFKALYQAGGISKKDFDVADTRLDTAKNAYAQAVAQVRNVRQQLSLRREGPRSEQIRQARAALAQAQAQYRLVKEGPRKETIDQARAQTDAARQVLAIAEQQLADTRLSAPFSGVVLSKSAEPGAYLNPGTPVVSIGQMDRVFLRAFINEPDLGRIHLGQKARVTTDAWPGKTYPGTLTFISSEAEFTPKAVQTFEERVKQMYRIKIELPNPNGELKAGMPADALLQVAP